MQTTGNLEMSEAELLELNHLRQEATFTQHEKFKCIWQSEMPITSVPKQLQTLIASLGGKMTVAKILKVDHLIEKHVHLHDSEIYYTGDGLGFVTLYDEKMQKTTEIQLTKNTYALTLKNQAHQVDSKDWTEFYGVKFEIH